MSSPTICAKCARMFEPEEPSGQSPLCPTCNKDISRETIMLEPMAKIADELLALISPSSAMISDANGLPSSSMSSDANAGASVDTPALNSNDATGLPSPIHRPDTKRDLLKTTRRNRLDPPKIKPLQTTRRMRRQPDPTDAAEPLKTTNRNNGSRLKNTGRTRIDEVLARNQQANMSQQWWRVNVALTLCLATIAMGWFFYQLFIKRSSDRVGSNVAGTTKLPISYNQIRTFLDAILQRPDHEANLAAIALMVAWEDFRDTFGKDLDIVGYLRKIDRMADKIQVNIQDKMEPREVIATMATHLYETEKFCTSQNGWDPSNLYLNMILDGKQGYCLGFAELWLALAERIKWRGKRLPIYGVLVPYHIFCRWDDGKNRHNIETLHTPPLPEPTVTDGPRRPVKPFVLKAGREFSDQFYQENYYITPESIAQGIYLRNISTKEVIACIYSNRANLQLGRLGSLKNSKERGTTFQKARQDIAQALLWQPGNAIALYNQAMILSQYQQQHQEALAILERLEKCDPAATVLYLAGSIHTHLHNYETAIAYFNRALQAPTLRRNLISQIPSATANVYFMWQKYDQAIAFCEEFISHNDRDSDAIVPLLFLLIRIHNLTGEYDKATAHALLLENLLGKTGEVLSVLGELALHQNDLASAKKHFEEALWSNSRFAPALYGMGLYWLRSNDLKNALECLEKALLYDPGLTEAQQELDKLRKRLANGEK